MQVFMFQSIRFLGVIELTEKCDKSWSLQLYCDSIYSNKENNIVI